MTRRRVAEWIKAALIVLLSCSAVVLFVMAAASGALTTIPGVEFLSDLFGGAAGETGAQQRLAAQAAARPVQISVCTDAGRASAMYDEAQLAAFYEQFGGALGQALEVAGTARTSTMNAVEQALGRPSVYFAYPGIVPLSALAEWLEAEYQGEGEAAWFVLSVRDDAVFLYFGDDANVWFCKTYLQPEQLTREMDALRPDGTAFAFESETLSGLAPLALYDLTGQYPIYSAEAASVYSEDFVSEIASRMGFNPYGDGYYTEADGTVVFSESDCTLRIALDGTVTLSNRGRADERFAADGDSIAARIEAARALLSELADGFLGEQSLYLTACAQSGETLTLSFGYYLNGIAVTLGDEPAATVVLDGTQIESCTVRLRSYTVNAQICSLLPARLAQALTDGGWLEIGYADTGDGALTAGWLTRAESVGTKAG